jgi:hypothetical protein
MAERFSGVKDCQKGGGAGKAAARTFCCCCSSIVAYSLCRNLKRPILGRG